MKEQEIEVRSMIRMQKHFMEEAISLNSQKMTENK